jgi:F-type H+-transporting ATPase subunit b
MIRFVLTLIFAAVLSVQTPLVNTAHAAGSGARHADFTGDEDHDGTANWLDSDSDDYSLMSLIRHGVNLTILFGLLYFFTNKSLRDTMKDRAVGIRKELADSAKQLDQAKKRYEELEGRLSRFEDEINEMRANAEELAKDEELKLIERANAHVIRIAESAERSIRDEANRTRKALRKEAVELAVDLAQSLLTKQVKATDQKRLAREFLDALDHPGVH